MNELMYSDLLQITTHGMSGEEKCWKEKYFLLQWLREYFSTDCNLDDMKNLIIRSSYQPMQQSRFNCTINSYKSTNTIEGVYCHEKRNLFGFGGNRT